MKKLILVLLVAAISGCASNEVKVRYVSDPPGATFYDGQRSLGRAPVVLTYAVTDEARNRRTMKLRGVTAIWVSGAKISYSDTNIVIDGTDRQLTAVRPVDAPGRDKDMSYALELEKLQMMGRQAEAQENAAYQASRAANAAEDARKAAQDNDRRRALIPQTTTITTPSGDVRTCTRTGSMVSCF